MSNKLSGINGLLHSQLAIFLSHSFGQNVCFAKALERRSVASGMASNFL